MSTRANFLIVTPNNKVHQFYSHCDGYPEGLGELLRRHILMSLGMLVLKPNDSIYDLFMQVIDHKIIKENYRASWEDEGVNDMESTIHIHGDIDYLYIVNFSKNVPDILYCDHAWNIDRNQSYSELINSICIPKKALSLNREIKMED
jgi:hypothetical protein